MFFFLIGITIFWFIYKDQNIEELKSILKNDVAYKWIWLSLFLGLLSHISRTIRWNYLIETLGHKPRFINSFCAVMVAYFMNLALPRMGEISRCGVMSRYENVSFSKLVGTVVVERLIDMVMLLLFVVIIIVSQFGEVLRLLEENPTFKQALIDKVTSPVTIVVLISIIALIYIFRKAFKNTPFYKKAHGFWLNLLEGIQTIRKMEKKAAFIFHSIFIWVMYYLMLYVVFFSFDFTSHLSPIAGLTTFVIAAFGMVTPVQGGIGAWHFMATKALAIYGVAEHNGEIFALVNWSSMNLMILVLGLVATIALPFLNRKNL